VSIDYTTLGMISSIKRRGILPTHQSTFMPADIVNILTEEMHSVIVPLLMREHEEYLVTNVDQAITSGQYSYFIPQKALGMKLRDLVLVNSDGYELSCPRVEPEDNKQGNLNAVQRRRGHILNNDQITLIPSSDDFTGFTLRFKIFRRPNVLVQSSQAGRISAINTSTKVVTLSTIPSTFTNALTYDFIKGTPSFRTHAENQAATTVAGFDITFTNTLPTDLAVGDWVAEYEYSPIPQIPYEVHRLLEQRAIIKILEGLKDSTGLKLARDAYDEMKDEVKVLLSPRVDGSPRKLVSSRGILDAIRSR
jgi:hypothetical protein